MSAQPADREIHFIKHESNTVAVVAPAADVASGKAVLGPDGLPPLLDPDELPPLLDPDELPPLLDPVELPEAMLTVSGEILETKFARAGLMACQIESLSTQTWKRETKWMRIP